MKICVLGAGGLLGHMLIRVLSDSNDVFGTTREAPNRASPLAKFLPQDKWIGGFSAVSTTSVDSIFSENQFEVVINCIGLIKQRNDQVDDRQMMSINGEFPHLLAEIANKNGAKVIQISTDCVFFGNKGNYVETDIPDPGDIYGRSKLLGELVDSTNLTLRTSHIGRELSVKKSFVEWILSQRSGRINGYSKAIYSGLTTKELSKIILRLLSDHKSLYGMFHVSSTAISKLNLIIDLNKLLNLGIQVIEDSSVQIDRSLNSQRFQITTNICPSNWKIMLEEFCDDQVTYD